jgi:hypothetical protein
MPRSAPTLRCLPALLLLVAGCEVQPTSLRLLIANSGITVSTMTITVFDPHGLIGQGRLTAPELPGALTVQGLLNRAQQLRVVVAAATSNGAMLGGARVAIAPDTLNSVVVQLGHPSDTDGDNVPDELDDCPLVADPEQRNSAGSGPGDACRGLPDLAQPSVDLAPPAPPSVDLAQAVVVADMATPPPDLLRAPSLCSTTNTILCAGFESGSIDPPFTAVSITNGSDVADKVHAFRGDYALHAQQNATATGMSASAMAISAQAYPSLDIYLRAWVYLPSPAPTGTFSFLRVQQGASPFYAVDLQVANGLFATTASRVGVTVTSMTSPPLDRWFCLEWQLHLASNGYTVLKLDDKPVSGIWAANTFDTTNNPTYTWLVIGLESGSAPEGIPARDLWIDELILDSKPVGCSQ